MGSKDWIFCFLSYDLKNEIENLSSKNIDKLNIPNLLFYIPETILFVSENEVLIESVLSKREVDTFIEEIQSLELDNNYTTSISLSFLKELVFCPN